MKLPSALVVVAILAAAGLAMVGRGDPAPPPAADRAAAAQGERAPLAARNRTPISRQADVSRLRQPAVTREGALRAGRGNLPATSAAPVNSPAATMREFEERRAGASAYLAALHRDFRGREGDPEAIALWADLIAAGTLTREQAVEHFLDSASLLQGAAPLARLYLAFFERVPDEAGWRHWRDHVASGRALDAIGDAFASSPEFAALYGTLDHGQFVDLAYRNTLGRDPTSAERAQWQSQLASGLATRGNVMLSLSESPAFRQAAANRVDASLLYSGLLGRTGDAPGLAAWMRSLEEERRTRAWMISGFLDSPEYRARAAAAAAGK